MTLVYCPICGASEHRRERRLNGNSTCKSGHTSPTAKFVADPVAVSVVKTETAALDIPAPETASLIIDPATVFVGTINQQRGALAIAVCKHGDAEDLAHLLGYMNGPNDQGIRVIPFAASALAYCGLGALLFRGLVVIPPRPGSALQRNSFDQWVESAIVPYLAPHAPRITL